jgi:TolB-like protein
MLRGSLLSGLLALCLSVFAWTSLAAADTLKRRVLVLPFENIQKNKDFSWMSDSIAENLKTELLETGRFEVLDVTLLRKIDPTMQFANLDIQNATRLAGRLNCEVAIIGRFSATKKKQVETVTVEAEGVDALEAKSVVVKKENAAAGAEMFDTVGHLAISISEELNHKLEPLDASEFKRDNKLELLIRRLEHPPTGFLDSQHIKNLILKPGFDIDHYEYHVTLSYEDARDIPLIEFELDYWGKQRKSHVTSTGITCENGACKVSATDPVLVIAENNKNNAVKYTIRLHYPAPRSPIVARWWVTAGYPYMQSLSSNPPALDQNGTLPLDARRRQSRMRADAWPLANTSP